MSIAINILIGLIALIHIYILWFEMFAWESRGPKVFRGFPKDLFPQTKAMAANQGLYNGFLAAGLFWSLYTENVNVSLFFIICVCIAALYGAYSTKSKRILIVQGTPAFIALAVLLINMFLV